MVSCPSTPLLVARVFAAACGLFTAACGPSPTYSGGTLDAAVNHHNTDAAVANGEPVAAQSIGTEGGVSRQPSPVPGGPGPAKLGTAAAPTLVGFTTASERRTAGDLTVQEDGFDTGNTVCADKLCATGRFEP
jgi:hypothetical protein